MGRATSNIAKAQAEYCDQIIQVECLVGEIGADYVELWLEDESQEHVTGYIRASIPSEELVDLEQSQLISVVGRVDPKIEKVTTHVNGLTFDQLEYSMSDAHVSKTTVEWTGVIHSKNSSFKHGYDFEVGNSIFLRVVYFDKDQTPEISNEEITVSGVVIAGQMHHGVIVK